MTQIQQCLCKWATNLLKSSVTNIKQIQDLSFTKALLNKIDNSVNWAKAQKFSSLLQQIGMYYGKDLGLDIMESISVLNVYKNQFELWQLLMGIAIKGSKRDFHINSILQMGVDQQNEMMRFISSIVQKLSSVKQPSLIQNQNTTQRDIMIQLSEQNSLLREQLQNLQQEYSNLLNNSKITIKDLQSQLKEFKKNQQLFYSQIAQAANLNISISGTQGLSPSEVIRDLITQINEANYQIQTLNQKIQNLEEIQLQLKSNYEGVISAEQMQQGSIISVKNANQQWEIQKLRQQIQQISQRELKLVLKVRELEEQKQHLKQVVSTKIRKDSNHQPKKDNQSMFLSPNSKNNRKKIQIQIPQQHQQSSIYQSITPSNNKQPKQTLKSQINQIKLPNIRNQLQKEIEYLKSQNQIISQQNKQLREINTMLEGVVNKYSEQTEERMKIYESAYNKMKVELGEESQEAKRVTKVLEQCLVSYQQRQSYYISRISTLQLKIQQLSKKKNKIKIELPQKNNFSEKGVQEKIIQNVPKQILKTQQKQSNIIEAPINETKEQQLPKIEVKLTQKQEQNKQEYLQEIIPKKMSNNLLTSMMSQNEQNQDCRLSVKSSLYQVAIENINQLEQNSQNKQIQKQQSRESSRQKNKSEINIQNNDQQNLQTIKKNQDLKDKIIKTIQQLQKQSKLKKNLVEKQLKKVESQYQRICQLYGNLFNDALSKSAQQKQQLSKIIPTKNQQIIIQPINVQNEIQKEQTLDLNKLVMSSPEYIRIKGINKNLQTMLISLIAQKQQTLKQLEIIKASQYKTTQTQLQMKQLCLLIDNLKMQNANNQIANNNESQNLKLNLKVLQKKNNDLQRKVEVLNEELNMLVAVLYQLRQLVKVKSPQELKKSSR